MRFAPVCPIHIYEAMSAEGLSVIGNYFLLLAHDVLQHEERYHRFFANQLPKQWGSKPFIIMDNSVIELGTSVSAEVLIKACNIVNADVLVIPDALQDGKRTYWMARQFVNQWMDSGNDIEQDVELMFVPQGNSKGEYEAFVREAYDTPNLRNHIKWIGVARNLTGRVYESRVQAMNFLRSVFGASVSYHMLGFSDYPDDDLLTCHFHVDHIAGIDSAVPLRIKEPLAKHIQDPGPRGDWWDTCKLTGVMMENVLEVRKRLGEL